ncbi:carboxylate-amine ligase [Humidisolicoccus flavus]|uniref:carboxylate-amine ligase n=1 Tax=Humidisolicoccus flavus TaxID=3111414 RepID=UPI003246262E
MEFSRSERSSIGIEWELALVDPETLELVPRAAELIARIDHPNIKGEFLTNTIELVTGVCAGVDQAIDEIRVLRDLALAAADELGIAIIASGTHPFSRWREQTVCDQERYQSLAARSGWWGERLVIFGVHTHVGVESKDKVIPMLSALTNSSPAILALSASSPFWEGEHGGYASERSMLFQQIPASGVPPRFADWADYEATVEAMVRSGVITGVNELRWDTRPAAHFGTIESRIADNAPSIEHLAAICGLTACIAERASRMIDAGLTPAQQPSWVLNENKWRVARYGLDATLLIDENGETNSVRADIERIVHEAQHAGAREQSIAESIGAVAALATAMSILRSGGSAAQQLQTFAASGSRGVTRALVEIFRA